MTKALSAVLLLWNVASILSFVVIRPKIQHHAALLASPFDSYHASLSRPPSNNNETANIDHKVSSASSAPTPSKYPTVADTKSASSVKTDISPKFESSSKYSPPIETKSASSFDTSLSAEQSKDSLYDDSIDDDLEERIAQLDRYEKMLQECLNSVTRAEKAVIAQNVGARPPISIRGIKEMLSDSSPDSNDIK